MSAGLLVVGCVPFGRMDSEGEVVVLVVVVGDSVEAAVHEVLLLLRCRRVIGDEASAYRKAEAEEVARGEEDGRHTDGSEPQLVQICHGHSGRRSFNLTKAFYFIPLSRYLPRCGSLSQGYTDRVVGEPTGRAYQLPTQNDETEIDDHRWILTVSLVPISTHAINHQNQCGVSVLAWH